MSEQDGVPEDHESDWGELASASGVSGVCDAETRARASRGRTSRRFAYASLFLAILSCPVPWAALRAIHEDTIGRYLLPPYWGIPWNARDIEVIAPFLAFVALAAVVAGFVAFATRKHALRRGGVVLRSTFGILAGSVNFLLLFLLMLAYFSKGRPNQDMVVCENNLRQMQTVFREYREANPGTFPALSSQPGVLMFEPKSIPPTSFADRLPFTCPTIRSAGFFARRPSSDDPASAYDDQSYYYLGYAVFNDEGVEAFAKAYRKRIAEGGTFDEDLVVEDGTGTRVLHRLSDQVLAQHWAANQKYELPSMSRIEAFAPSLEGNREVAYQTVGVAPTDDVPILIERDRGHVYTDWGPPAPRGANVLYAYHGVQFIQRGTWPMTEKTQRILAELAEEVR